ncbi:MAG TPA: L-threonylcarbamoyladenylate synthase [Anaerolineae bacterium]|nr:L-threonylcarbamoyladenylate synthase [Anaerolineae bacterium]
MMAEVLKASDVNSVRRAVEVLRRGEVVAFPTDTVYGLGAHHLIASAVEKLYVIKRRDRGKAIPLLIAGREDLAEVASQVPDVAWRLAERFWPGPVTIVLPRAPGLLSVLTAGTGAVAVRMPDHGVASRLISMLGVPLAATSANLSGQTECVTVGEVLRVFGRRVELILDGGRCPGGMASTVVDVAVDPPVVRRRGALVSEVEAFLAGGA